MREMHMNPIITELQKDKRWKAYVQGNPAVAEYGHEETIAIAMLLLRLQGVRVIHISGPFVFSTTMWLCWLIISWLLIMDKIAMETFTGIMWGLVLLLGIFGGAYASRS